MMNKTWKRWLQPLALGALLLGLQTGATAASFSRLVVFGDSLSDTGNTRASIPGGNLPIISVPAGYGNNGRFSNGNVWHESLAPLLGVGTATNSLTSGANNYNYAYGGARIDTATGPSTGLLTQYNQYNSRVGGVSDANALFVVWGGGNDMRDLVGNANPLAAIGAKLSSLEQMLTNLIGTGATNFLIPNLPDLGLIPENRGTGNQANASAVTRAWNEGLLEMLTGLSGMASFYHLDVFSAFNDILDNPSTYGFTNTTGQCRSTGGSFFNPTEISCANADSWVFWDAIHPTRAAHAVLGNAAYNLLVNGSPLSQVPVPATLLLALLALGLMGGARRLQAQPRGTPALPALAA